ncbi:hypothetical protein H1W37_18165 [Stappia taiwanensis]|uniref:Alcohol dehydrogenase-like N-terminal domain-containing protein n=1 Tax=Stappia taiwanensis TaxID=992267 RepID=A0A838XV26_9HYPH|nr:hypothetical protein [Stappia taiwanensis]MBA4613587.1 hypothetical protein [Stappia taiwanensis]GGE98977.1 hypothetical protein GCM10007285_28170 [Stappia taiwanensis]
MPKAQVIHEMGPPDVMKWEEWPVPDPPTSIGFEGGGVAEDVGEGVTYFRPGDRVAYGHVSGPPDPVDVIKDLGRHGSLFITRPAIMHCLAKRSDLEWTARDLFKAISDGILDVNINYEYPLKDAVKAHEGIEPGKTLGATVLIP